MWHRRESSQLVRVVDVVCGAVWASKRFCSFPEVVSRGITDSFQGHTIETPFRVYGMSLLGSDLI